MRWAAVDFETATHSRDSACALGVVVVEDGTELLRQAWLIRPPGNAYHRMNISVHGIQPGDTEHAPDFADVWAEAMHVIGDRTLVAHNASFDVGVIRGCCATYSIAPPPARYVCTVQLSRRTWPELGAHKLPIVAQHVGATLNHHDALSDAAACSQVLHACITEARARSLDELALHHGIRDRRVDEP
jgi:DNA polymerase-3 subunit epsilon